MYYVQLHRRASHFLQKLPLREKKRVVEKISLLEKNPFNHSLDIKKLEATKGSYRLRVGSLRIIYEINTEKKTIYIQEVGFRGSIY